MTSGSEALMSATLRNDQPALTPADNAPRGTETTPSSTIRERSGLDQLGWANVRRLEDLSADCFNRPLLEALCERFAAIGESQGQPALGMYARAKLSLQTSVVSHRPTVESARQYLALKKQAQVWGEPLLESIATAKLAAAVSQAYVGKDDRLFGVQVREELEQMLQQSIPDLAALSQLKKRLFSEALNLAARGRSGTVAEAEEALFEIAQRDGHDTTRSVGHSNSLDPLSRAIVGAAVGIANEYKHDLEKGYTLFEAVLKIHPAFLAARLAAFYNCVARLEQAGCPQPSLIDAIKQHLAVCVESVPPAAKDALHFSNGHHLLVLELDDENLTRFVNERKSVPIKMYAESALRLVGQYEAGQINELQLAKESAATQFAPIESRARRIKESFCCAVENSWRAKLSAFDRPEASQPLLTGELEDPHTTEAT